MARTSRLTHPNHSQGDESGTSTPTAAPAAAAAEDLDFSDIKKKKKSSKKKANLEEFERQLDESRSKAKEDGDEEDEGPDGERTLDHLEDADLGDDPFAAGGGGGAGAEGAAGDEPWLKSDRDYTYQEVRRAIQLKSLSLTAPAAADALLLAPARRQPRPPVLIRKAVHHRAPLDPQRREQEDDLCQRHRHLQADAQTGARPTHHHLCT